MTHRQRINQLLLQTFGLCDGCISKQLGIERPQTVNGVCSKSENRIRRATGICSACKRSKILNHLNETPESDAKHPPSAVDAGKRRHNYVREEDLRQRFNDSLTETLGIVPDDYYSRLDFDHLLRLKEGLARIHDIVTLKLTFAMVKLVTKRLNLDAETHAALLRKVNAAHPNASGFDIDWHEPNIIAEIKGCIPMNRGEVFGDAQRKGLTNDVLQMLGQPPLGKSNERVAKTSKIYRPHRAEAIKLLGLYDSPVVREAARQWRQNLLQQPAWKPLLSTNIEDLPTSGNLAPGTVYLVYLKPAAH